MEDELRNLAAYGAYERISHDDLARLGVDGAAVIPGKWVKQPRPDGSVRCRVVATEVRHGPREAELYAPTPAPCALKLVLAHASAHLQLSSAAWGLRSADVSAAFLNADVDGIVVIRPPVGARREPGELWLAKKAFLGLRRSPRLWAERVRADLGEIGLHGCSSDLGLYVSSDGLVALMVHVDDVLASGPPARLDQIFAELRPATP